ncbi:YdcF family protein [Rhizobium halophytocola]|uniref:Uncharacterized SAM-binding protein YcdF (DUF218 family) n=1 Tax=Rhizobium halophytocola TaxID=735519 RepID=A0ABS4E2J7_9HYPH|nr:YdcF family protein [Rhizobium halophytocola]MBP1852176.1 uncharacterized SAM-binding protein YcdF (DUF218 family) [Rhizobium halophytocola]
MTTGRKSRPDGQSSDHVFRRRGPLRRTLRYCGYVALVFAAVFCGGFLIFVDSVTNLEPPAAPAADAIVVLTGGYQRIDQAVELLERGAGKRLLISGAHPTTTAEQIRRTTNGPAKLFGCCVDVGYEAQDTIGNANETANWIRDNAYRTILVVTSNYHMPRSLLELRRINRDTAFIPYPVVNSDLKHTDWMFDPNALRTLLSEYGKFTIAYVRDITGWHGSTGLRDPELAPSAP